MEQERADYLEQAQARLPEVKAKADQHVHAFLSGDAVLVSRSDLEYVLGHVADEIHGHPDPAHWRLPLFTEALERLNAAVRRDT
jgi:hypothetical protein